MNILITGAWRNCDCNIEKIKHMGHNVAFMQRENDSLPCEYDWVDAVICNSLFLFHPIEKFVNLKYIQLTSAGYDRVPLDYVKKHNIDIYNARGVYSIPMAEYAVASVLQLYKNFTFFMIIRKINYGKKTDLCKNCTVKQFAWLDVEVLAQNVLKDLRLLDVRLLVRINPIHEATKEYCSSKEEIDIAIANGADIIMLPFFKTLNEVAQFLTYVDGRV